MREETTDQAEVAIFIVRASRKAGRLNGVVERVRTGEKVRFQDADAIGNIITQIVEAEAGDSTEMSG